MITKLLRHTVHSSQNKRGIKVCDSRTFYMARIEFGYYLNKTKECSLFITNKMLNYFRTTFENCVWKYPTTCIFRISWFQKQRILCSWQTKLVLSYPAKFSSTGISLVTLDWKARIWLTRCYCARGFHLIRSGKSANFQIFIGSPSKNKH